MPRSRIRTISLALLLALVLVSCGDDAVPDPLADDARTRIVTLSVSVIDDRDPAGAPVVVTGYGTVEADRFAVTVLDTGLEGTGETCEEATEVARSIGDAIGSDIDECRTVTQTRPFAADQLRLVVGSDGTVELPLLPDLAYEVGSFVEIVPGEDGCTWNGAGEIAADATSMHLHLDSDGCSGG